MNEGWYAIANVNREYTLHFIVSKQDSTLCRRYVNVSKLGERISSTPIGCVECTNCVKALVNYLETGMTFTEAREQNMGSRYDRPHKKFRQITDKLSSKHSENQEGDWRNTVCPNCKTPVIFFNKSRKKEHYCTVCKNDVTLPSVVVAI